jgi:hypothetical protein
VTNVPGKLRVQEYHIGSEPKKFVWAAWSPMGEGKATMERFQNFPGRLVSAERMPLLANVEVESDLDLEMDAAGFWRFRITESPLYLFFEAR